MNPTGQYNPIWSFGNWHTYNGNLTQAEAAQNPPYHDFDLGVRVDAINGHWYYGKIEVAGMSDTVNRLETFYGNGIVNQQLGMYGVGVKEAVWKAYPTNSGIWRAYKIFRLVPNTSAAATGVNLSATVRITLLDVTEMFGAGVEPTTVAAFKAAYPNYNYMSPFAPQRIGGAR